MDSLSRSATLLAKETSGIEALKKSSELGTKLIKLGKKPLDL
jgi:hypothetical protein